MCICIKHASMNFMLLLLTVNTNFISVLLHVRREQSAEAESREQQQRTGCVSKNCNFAMSMMVEGITALRFQGDSSASRHGAGAKRMIIILLGAFASMSMDSAPVIGLVESRNSDIST